MKQIKCDRCGNTTEATYQVLTLPVDMATTIAELAFRRELDLCPSCIRELRSFLTTPPPRAKAHTG